MLREQDKGRQCVLAVRPCRMTSMGLNQAGVISDHARKKVKITFDWSYIGRRFHSVRMLPGFWQMKGKCTAGTGNTFYGYISSMHLHDLLCHGQGEPDPIKPAG